MTYIIYHITLMDNKLTKFCKIDIREKPKCYR